MAQLTRRGLRGMLVSSLAIAALAVSGGTALGAHQIAQSGTPGSWVLPDSAANPAAKCSYENGGTAGSIYLTGIRLFNGLEIQGTHAGLRSVGYQMLIQHLESGTWVTVKHGQLITGQASQTHNAVLPGGRTRVPVEPVPNRFRAALKLVWYRSDASVEGTRTIVVDSYVRLNGGVASNCKGRVITAPH